MGVQIHQQYCQNTVVFLLSKCETPIEITWSLSINFSLSWSNLRRNTQGKVAQYFKHEKIIKKMLLGLWETLCKWPALDMNFQTQNHVIV